MTGVDGRDIRDGQGEVEVEVLWLRNNESLDEPKAMRFIVFMTSAVNKSYIRDLAIGSSGDVVYMQLQLHTCGELDASCRHVLYSKLYINVN